VSACSPGSAGRAGFLRPPHKGTVFSRPHCRVHVIVNRLWPIVPLDFSCTVLLLIAGDSNRLHVVLCGAFVFSFEVRG